MRISDWSSDVCSSDLLDAIRTALARQLGPVWGGSADLPPHLRCLFAAFALKAARKREKSQELLDRLNEIWATKGHKAKPKAMDKALLEDKEIGRASCRERVCQYV